MRVLRTSLLFPQYRSTRKLQRRNQKIFPEITRLAKDDDSPPVDISQGSILHAFDIQLDLGIDLFAPGG